MRPSREVVLQFSPEILPDGIKKSMNERMGECMNESFEMGGTYGDIRHLYLYESLDLNLCSTRKGGSCVRANE